MAVTLGSPELGECSGAEIGSCSEPVIQAGRWRNRVVVFGATLALHCGGPTGPEPFDLCANVGAMEVIEDSRWFSPPNSGSSRPFPVCQHG